MIVNKNRIFLIMVISIFFKALTIPMIENENWAKLSNQNILFHRDELHGSPKVKHLTGFQSALKQ